MKVYIRFPPFIQGEFSFSEKDERTRSARKEPKSWKVCGVLFESVEDLQNASGKTGERPVELLHGFLKKAFQGKSSFSQNEERG